MSQSGLLVVALCSELCRGRAREGHTGRGAPSRGGLGSRRRICLMNNRRPPSRSRRGDSSAHKRPSSRSRARGGEGKSGKAPIGGTPPIALMRAQLGDFASVKRSIVYEGMSGSKHVSARTLAILASAAIALVLLVPALNRYLDQQRALRSAQAELEQVLDHNVELQEQLTLWTDDEYVKAQARDRLGYVVPGETLYVITDSREGSAAERLEARTSELLRQRRAITPWYMTMWESLEVAGRVDEDGKIDNPDAVPIVEGTSEDSASEGSDAAEQ